MESLLIMDAGDYIPGGQVFRRDSARAIIISDGRVAMVHSLLYDYYKFPGGGIEDCETPIQAVIRETREEAGLIVKEDTLREYGTVRCLRKSDHPHDDIFRQDNHYFLCEVEETVIAQKLDDYELEERFTLEYVSPRTAIRANRHSNHGPKEQQMLDREALVLECLMEDGLLPCTEDGNE